MARSVDLCASNYTVFSTFKVLSIGNFLSERLNILQCEFFPRYQITTSSANSVQIAKKTETAKQAIKVLPRGRRDDMHPDDGTSTVAKIAADLRPSAN